MSWDSLPATRDDEDAAAVLSVVLALSGAPDQAEPPQAQSIWGDPAHRIGPALLPSATAWWASGMPR